MSQRRSNLGPILGLYRSSGLAEGRGTEDARKHDVPYVHYLRDKIDRDSPQPLLRTVRGVDDTRTLEMDFTVARAA